MSKKAKALGNEWSSDVLDRSDGVTVKLQGRGETRIHELGAERKYRVVEPGPELAQSLRALDIRGTRSTKVKAQLLSMAEKTSILLLPRRRDIGSVKRGRGRFAGRRTGRTVYQVVVLPGAGEIYLGKGRRDGFTVGEYVQSVSNGSRQGVDRSSMASPSSIDASLTETQLRVLGKSADSRPLPPKPSRALSFKIDSFAWRDETDAAVEFDPDLMV